MLLARLGRLESRRVRDLCPGQTGTACGEQHAGFQSIDLSAGRGQERQRAGDGIRGKFGGAPKSVMSEINRRRRRRCRAPRAGIKLIGTKGTKVLLRSCFPPGLRMVVANPVRGIILVFHAAILHNQQNVVNILLKGGGVILELKDAFVDTSGGKAGALGALLRAGLLVPDGFVVPFAEYRAGVGGCHAEPVAGKPKGLEEALEKNDCVIGPMPISAGLRDAIARGLDVLGNPSVAVRSSANSEDTAEASAAGQYDSILAVQGAGAVADAVQACWASLHSGRAVNYRSAIDRDEASMPAAMAVLVQRLIDAEVSGVMFTPPRPEEATHIEASWGLGPTVAGGTVTPDSYRITADGAASRHLADKRIRMDREGARLITGSVPNSDRGMAVLDAATVARLARLGREVASLLGGPQDIEWAIAEGRIWILQARPVTATPPLPVPHTVAASPNAASSATLVGTPGSQGAVAGTARIVRGPDDFARVCRGDILVCPHTDPAWTPLLSIAAGVVTETGGVLSHAAIVARELRIPAVLGVVEATTRLHDGTLIFVDGTAGTVVVDQGVPSRP